MRVRLTQLDGKLPNLALMRLAAWHRGRGHEVVFTRQVEREMFEGEYDAVYGSAIFTASQPLIERFRQCWPSAIVGGTGSTSAITVEQVVGGRWERCDYRDHPGFLPSLGFTARGCRMKCRFCMVPGSEGRPRSVNAIADLWRGPGHARKLLLLDNDFFGQPEEQWQARVAEIRGGDFRVCFSQGINIRLVDDRVAEALASVQYRDDQFRQRRLYTAWDNLGDERVFFRGVERLDKAGVPPRHLMAYMLVGFDPAETWDRIHYRFGRMVAAGIRPYPMVFDPARRDLKQFQRWAVTGLYRAVPWADYDPSIRKRNAGSQLALAVA
ncbi:radical SAM protein [Magnetospirillum sp. 15-1]|uniref:radical SAM protein n=1 Tax=Magnetospirillum sp. 15-1 TaxID=1979370 RepID=UPI000BBCA651|nr:radical SAM protein [Magnetospirillum sp. 15-1]